MKISRTALLEVENASSEWVTLPNKKGPFPEKFIFAYKIHIGNI